MAITLVETVGSASANTYATLTEFNTFLEGVFPAPATYTDDNKNRALAYACKQLARKVWRGWRIDSTQALDWPRSGVVNPDKPGFAAYYGTSEIPERIKRAQMLTALALLEGSYTPNAADVEGDVTQWSSDGVSEGYAKPRSGSTRNRAELPQEVIALIAPLVMGARIAKA